ncbi:sensor histidine kinase [Pseudoalteromonas sp. H105]|uniref:sensor histidine kinase n=1 Tax=Pseudoalteromonas sp. H105 TaxID=1348393 RepID=UPI000732266D|nr:ATP-binding protein [Pseudoalteromonas sp. H105]KTF16975.1 histidine kinase [Pseudoalteromonas sp. H105]
MTVKNDDFEQAYYQERAARIKAEQLIQDKSQVLYALNQELVKKVADLELHEQLFIQADKMSTLGTLSAGIAHEINNPLAYVMSNNEYLLKTRLTIDKVLLLNERFVSGKMGAEALKSALKELRTAQSFIEIGAEIQELIEDSDEGLRRINSTVRNLLDFSRPANNEKELSDMTDGVRNALKLLKNQLVSYNITTNITTLPLSMCNLSTINQVVVNLLINAKHACDAVDEREGHIHVYTGFENEKIVISVTDNGCGMSDDVKTQIFNPFFTTKAVGTGTGMGMSLVYTMVTDHLGTIDIDSTEYEGTKVSCFFPVLTQ